MVIVGREDGWGEREVGWERNGDRRMGGGGDGDREMHGSREREMGWGGEEREMGWGERERAVSYTHLTLPTTAEV